jgi:hypothetical protein
MPLAIDENELGREDQRSNAIDFALNFREQHPEQRKPGGKAAEDPWQRVQDGRQPQPGQALDMMDLLDSIDERERRRLFRGMY